MKAVFIFLCGNRIKLQDGPDDYQNSCLAVAWDGQNIFMSVFEGVISTLQSHSHLPPLPLCQETSETHISLAGWPRNESLSSRPECLWIHLHRQPSIKGHTLQIWRMHPMYVLRDAPDLKHQVNCAAVNCASPSSSSSLSKHENIPPWKKILSFSQGLVLGCIQKDLPDIFKVEQPKLYHWFG